MSPQTEQEELIKSLAKKSDEHEFYTPMPKGYEIGKTKYVIVTGSVISGVGKGIFSASLAKLLKDQGLHVEPVKFDGYLNVDAGTLNPYRHGEVFVLDDGTECDMDLGTYERFLDQDVSKDNYLTAGKLFSQIIQKEREGKYLGRDVQFIPHVTGEIKAFIRHLSAKTSADVVIIEVGGTAGDIESAYFLEALRELAYEEGAGNTCFINVTYILKPSSLGEHKSKAAQLGIRTLMSLGIQPQMIICRAGEAVPEKIREKLSIFSNVPIDRVIGLEDRQSIYQVPLALKEAKADEAVTEILKLKGKLKSQEKALGLWEDFEKKMREPKKEINVAITGKYTGLHDAYASIINALEHAGEANRAHVNVHWVDTTKITTQEEAKKALAGMDGIIVPGGFGSRGVEGKIQCVQDARENNIPYFGLCYGFQMAVIEYARNVLGLKNAHTTEVDPACKDDVIDILPEQKKIEGLGGNMRLGGHKVDIKKGSFAEKLYGESSAHERFRHRYECNPKYVEALEKAGLMFSGKAPHHPIMQILELPNHPFFVGVQFHPEFTSRPLRPQPLFKGFVAACLNARKKT
ncbi:MAG TPA: CTP synthase [Candidatus Norongarragalinales archaeon]|nr:CTP synthase [Candidatus Norongarragalinales archaeon]